MKNVVLLLLAIALSQVVFSKRNHVAAIEQLRNTELAFSKLCGEKGMKAAFLFYADKDVIKAEGNGNFPIIGIDSLAASFGNERENFKLEWYPTKVEVSASDDLGYTIGNWIITNADNTKKYGIYYTIWKKQKNGDWKFVFDGGNSTPEPKQ
jgi:ketosteroid isomerase-like protein